MYSHLLSPLTIRGLTLRNRSVMTGMGTQMPGPDSYANDTLVEYHRARARGGVGLNTIEVSSVHQPTAPPNFLSIGDDRFIPGLKKITDAIHNEGGKASVQLWQAGINAGMRPVVPLLVPSDFPMGEDNILPAMTTDTIREVVESYGTAAARAVTAGFDTLEIHAGHSYLIHSFLSSQTNHRTDDYGGSLKNRSRFLLEIIDAVRENIPADMPLFMRINAHDDYYEHGLSTEDIIQVCKAAKDHGVDVANVSRGNTLTPLGLPLEVPPLDLAPGFNIENAAKIKKETGLIVLGVGRIHHPDLAEKFLSSGDIDLVAMSRAHLADPALMTKVREHRIKDIVLCTGCNQGCFDAFIDPEEPHISCIFNPAVGREKEMELHPTDTPLNIMVIGGGPVGMEIARILHLRGHNPTIYDSHSALGGRFPLAAQGPKKEEFALTLEHMIHRIKVAKIPLVLDTMVTEAFLRKIAPDAVFYAPGSRQILLEDIPHKTALHVFDDSQTLGENIVVYGGDMVALECAEHLRAHGHTVTLLTTGDAGHELGRIRTPMVLQRIKETKIPLYDNITDLVWRDKQVQCTTREGTPLSLSYDDLVVSLGSVPLSTSTIESTCRELAIPCFTITGPKGSNLLLKSFKKGAELARTFDR